MASSWEDLELNDHRLAALSLAAQPPPPPPRRDSPPQQPVDDQAHKARDPGVAGVDQALTDALTDPRGRITGDLPILLGNSTESVLRLDAEVERFCRDDSRQQHVFSGDLTPYQRMLAHRVAQHYGMQTSVEVVEGDQPQGQVIARKCASAMLPTVKLPSIGAPTIKDSDSAAEKKSVRLMRRTGSEEKRISKMGSSSQLTDEENMARSVAQREEEYVKARQRIFSSGNLEATGSEVDVQGGAAGIDLQQQHPQQMQSPSEAQNPKISNVVSPVEDPPTSCGKDVEGAIKIGGRGQQNNRGGGVARSGGSKGDQTTDESNYVSGSGRGRMRSGGKGGKAVFRDKDKDAQDPDFQRGRGRFEPRFDGGYGMNAAVRGHPGQQQGGLYVMPTYGAEFPSLGSPGGSQMPCGMPLTRPPPPPPPPGAGGTALPPGMPPGWPGGPMPLSIGPYAPAGLPQQFPHGMPMPPSPYGMPPPQGGMYAPAYGRLPMHPPHQYGFVPGPGGMPTDAQQIYGGYGPPVVNPPSEADQRQR